MLRWLLLLFLTLEETFKVKLHVSVLQIYVELEIVHLQVNLREQHYLNILRRTQYTYKSLGIYYDMY